MKNNLIKYSVTVILTALAVVLFMRKCGDSVSSKTERAQVNTDSIKAVGKAEEDTLNTLRDIATNSANTATVYIDRWHKAKADTSRPYKAVITDCDTTLNKLQQANTDLCNELNQSYEVNAIKNKVIAGQDSNYKHLEHINDSLLNAPSKFWKGFKWGFVVGNIAGAVGVGIVR